MECGADDNSLRAHPRRCRILREQARRSKVRNHLRRLQADRDARASMQHSIRARAILWLADEDGRTAPLPGLHRHQFESIAAAGALSACLTPHPASSRIAAEPDAMSA